VVGLDDVVQILDLLVLCVLRALAFGLQLGESGGIGRRLVGVDDLRLFPILQPPESLGKKTLRRRRVPRRGEIVIDRVAQLVDSSVEVRPICRGLSRRSRRPGPLARRAFHRGTLKALQQSLFPDLFDSPAPVTPNDYARRPRQAGRRRPRTIAAGARTETSRRCARSSSGSRRRSWRRAA
jgi:hypothetical protein